MRRICPQPPDALQQTFQRARLILGVELGIEPAASMWRPLRDRKRIPTASPPYPCFGRGRSCTQLCVMRLYLVCGEAEGAPKRDANEAGRGGRGNNRIFLSFCM